MPFDWWPIYAYAEKCSWFCTNEDDVCYHQTFLSNDNIAELQAHYNLLQSTLDEQHQSYEHVTGGINKDPSAPAS